MGAFTRKFTDRHIGNSKRNAIADYNMKIFTECLDHYRYIHWIIRLNETCPYIFSESHLYTHPPLLSLLHFPISPTDTLVVYMAFEEYCNSLATSKGRRSNLPFHYASFSTLFPHITSNPLSSTSGSHVSQFPFKSNRIYNLHSLVHSSRSFLSSECWALFFRD